MEEQVEPNDTHLNGDEVTSGTKSTRAIKLRVTDIEWLQDNADTGESPAAALTRMREEFVSIRARCDSFEAAVTLLREENDVLQDGLDKLGKLGSRTALTTPGQTAIGDFGGAAVKEAMDAISDVCDDEVACVKTALYLLDKKAEVIDKELDREHSRSEKQKDRDHTISEKDKDRKLKQDLEVGKAEHQKKLALIKRGIVDESDLEGVVFLGSIEKRKTPGEILAEKKKRAYHAASGEDDDDFDGELVDNGESEYGGESDDHSE